MFLLASLDDELIRYLLVSAKMLHRLSGCFLLVFEVIKFAIIWRDDMYLVAVVIIQWIVTHCTIDWDLFLNHKNHHNIKNIWT